MQLEKKLTLTYHWSIIDRRRICVHILGLCKVVKLWTLYIRYIHYIYFFSLISLFMNSSVYKFPSCLFYLFITSPDGIFRQFVNLILTLVYTTTIHFSIRSRKWYQQWTYAPYEKGNWFAYPSFHEVRVHLCLNAWHFVGVFLNFWPSFYFLRISVSIIMSSAKLSGNKQSP